MPSSTSLMIGEINWERSSCKTFDGDWTQFQRRLWLQLCSRQYVAQRMEKGFLEGMMMKMLKRMMERMMEVFVSSREEERRREPFLKARTYNRLLVRAVCMCGTPNVANTNTHVQTYNRIVIRTHCSCPRVWASVLSQALSNMVSMSTSISRFCWDGFTCLPNGRTHMFKFSLKTLKQDAWIARSFSFFKILWNIFAWLLRDHRRAGPYFSTNLTSFLHGAG